MKELFSPEHSYVTLVSQLHNMALKAYRSRLFSVVQGNLGWSH